MVAGLFFIEKVLLPLLLDFVLVVVVGFARGNDMDVDVVSI